MEVEPWASLMEMAELGSPLLITPPLNTRFPLQQSDNPQAWNLFGQIIHRTQDIRHNRFCLRLMLKVRDTRGHVRVTS